MTWATPVTLHAETVLSQNMPLHDKAHGVPFRRVMMVATARPFCSMCARVTIARAARTELRGQSSTKGLADLKYRFCGEDELQVLRELVLPGSE